MHKIMFEIDDIMYVLFFQYYVFASFTYIRNKATYIWDRLGVDIK